MYRLLQSGAEIFIKEDGITFSIEKGVNPLYILERMMRYGSAYDESRRQEGIEKAKKEDKYKGRKRIEVDKFVFDDIAVRFELGSITEQQVLERLNISRSTFYRRMKEWKADALHKKE